MQITQKKLMFQIMYITRADFEHSSFDTKNKSGEKIRYSFFLVSRKMFHSIQYHCHTRSSRRLNKFFLAFQCCHLLLMKMVIKAYTRTNTIETPLIYYSSGWRIHVQKNCANHAKPCRTLLSLSLRVCVCACAMSTNVILDIDAL